MAKRGRPSTFNDKIGEVIIRLAREGKTAEQIADVVGVSKRTFYNWLGKHQDLMLAVRESKLAADELVEAALFSRATGYSHPEEKLFAHEGIVMSREVVTKHYPPDTQAAMFWLRNRQPERWKEKSDGTDVTVNNNTHVHNEKLSDEELRARLAGLLTKHPEVAALLSKPEPPEPKEEG